MRKGVRKMCMYAALVACVAPVLWGCGSSSSSPASVTPDADPVISTPKSSVLVVTDTAGAPVEGATVYAIPVADVEALATQPITLDNGNYTTEALGVDEPLEDLVNGNYSPVGGGVATYQSFVTDAAGKATITDDVIGESDKFFIYVQPATDDTDHLPGGSLCREAVTGASLIDAETGITVSTKPSAAANFVGTSTCLVCHPDQAGVKKTMHRNAFMAPGEPSLLQDMSEFDTDDGVYDMGAALDKYTAGDATSGGTTIWFYDYDGTRKFDKWKTLESDPGAGVTKWATVRIYSNGGSYYAQFTNLINPADPNSGMIHEVVLTYGGGIYKLRPMTVVGDSIFMVPLQYNARGDETSGDRTKKIWRDYHLDWWMSITDANGDKVPDAPATSTFKSIPSASNSVDVQCAPCHFNGYSVTQNADGYYSASGVADAAGETHPVTGVRQELNIGCETCHGPGSEHVAALGSGKAIVSPQNLTPERANIICGQCHSRSQGNDAFGLHKDSPLDQDNKMMVAGTSRADFLANHTSRDDAASGDLWGDGLHSKSHHQQYTDFIQSAKYRNGSKLLICADCHDLHGPGTDRHQLSGTTDSTLCTSCHTGVVASDHQWEKTGIQNHSGGLAQCINCHNPKTSTSGAGTTPTTAKTGSTSGKVFYHGDISSHRFDVPDKTESATGMPVPYTNPCGLCHSMSGI